MYSQEMKDLVHMLLNKDEHQRPQVIDIMRIKFVQEHMKQFVESQGKINLNPDLKIKKDIDPKAVVKLKGKDESTLTAAEKAKLRKE